MKNKWRKLLGEFVITSIFPPRCVVCDAILEPECKEGVHDKCRQKLVPVGKMCVFIVEDR